jgi:hypothetical protein
MNLALFLLPSSGHVALMSSSGRRGTEMFVQPPKVRQYLYRHRQAGLQHDSWIFMYHSHSMTN